MDIHTASQAALILSTRAAWIVAEDAALAAVGVVPRREQLRLNNAASDAYDAYAAARDAAPHLQPVEDIETGRVWIERKVCALCNESLSWHYDGRPCDS